MKDRLTAFAEQAGFVVKDETETRVVKATGVPCLLANGKVGACAIEKSYDENGKPDSRIGGDVHAVKIITDGEGDGRVYNADGSGIGNHIGSDGERCSNISIKKDSPEGDKSPREVVYRYAKHIVGAVKAKDPKIIFRPEQGPFRIPNTYEARAELGPVQDRIREQRIAIIGLGGTGAYVLDLVAKTPVAEIHLLDSDFIDWHNFMRAPGAPTCAEIALQRRKDRPRKVDYYLSKYTSLRDSIQAHPFLLNKDNSTEFLSKNPVDYAFVCIDQRQDSSSPRQDDVYSTLSEARIPFIDSGVSITLDDHTIRGAVTISTYAAGCQKWKDAIPNAKVEGNMPSYRNVQLPEVNALAASLAVVEWRRRTEQYVSESAGFLHKCRLEKPRIITRAD